MLDGTFGLKKKVFLNEGVEISDEKRLLATDIFICFSSGSRKHVGKVAYITSNTDYYAGGFMGILRSNGTNLLTKYLFEVLNSELYRDVIRNTATGSNIENLSSTLKQVQIPVPSFNVQKQLVEEVNPLQEEISNAQAVINGGHVRKAAILKNYL